MDYQISNLHFSESNFSKLDGVDPPSSKAFNGNACNCLERGTGHRIEGKGRGQDVLGVLRAGKQERVVGYLIFL